MTVEDVLQGGRPLPWLFELAAVLENESVADLYADAGAIARSLSGAVDLFDLPAVSVSFDTSPEAEAVGCEVDAAGDRPTVSEGYVETVDDAFDVPIGEAATSGRVPTFVEATERLAATVGDADVLGGVTGPARLTDHLLAEPAEAPEAVVEEAMFTAADVGVEVANAHLDAGADGIAVLEPDGIDREFYADAATALSNVLDHYEARGVLVTERVAPDEIASAGEVGFDAVTGRVEDPAAAAEAAAEAGVALGVGVPRRTFAEGPDAVEEFLAELPGDAAASSEWTVPAETRPEAVHALSGPE